MSTATHTSPPHTAPLTSFGGYHTLAFNAMGTQNEVVFSAASLRMADAFHADLMDWLSHFETRISRYRPDSLVSAINREAGGDWIPIDPETEELIGLCDWFHWKTGGIFDPSLGPLAELWDYKRIHETLPAPAAIRETLAHTGWHKAERKPGHFRLPEPGMSIDLGGIGKEFAVDKAIALAKQHGIRDILVNFGRDIRAYGHPPEGGCWRIGLENPLAPDRCWTGIALGDMAIAGSGTYARGFELAGNRYSHLLDPRSGYPASSGCAAAWVIAPTSTEAGILSTTAAILPPVEALQRIESSWQAAACLWTSQGLYHSRRFHEYTLNEN